MLEISGITLFYYLNSILIFNGLVDSKNLKGNIMNNLILNPVLCMAILTFFMMIWMYATRIPASRTLEEKGIDLQVTILSAVSSTGSGFQGVR